MSRMHNPPHPGAVLQDTVLRADGGITLTEFAKRLCVSRVALSRVVHGHAAISAELAIRLASALGGSAESWLRMQLTHDLWHATKKKRPKIAKMDLQPSRVDHAAERRVVA
jgi:addiction module HigA family antidote